MEVYSSSYKLSKDNKEYILTLSIFGNSIRITCRSALNETALNYTRDFSIEDLKNLNQMFISVNKLTEALQAIDQALKMEKVDIVEEGENLQIKFYISQKGAHVIENAQTVTTDYNTFSQTNEAYHYKETPYENYDLNQNFNFQQGNTYQDSIPIEGAINENETPYLDALNTETLNLNINSSEGYTDYSNLEYQNGTENLTGQYIGTDQAYTETANTYLGGTIAQYENNFNEYESSTPVNYNLPIEDTNKNQYLQSFQETTQTVETVNQYIQPSTNFEGPYIQPADDLNQNTEPVQTDQYYQQYTATNIEENPDDKIDQLEGATSNLKNDHQLIQDQLNTLSNQINSYKDQLTLMEKGKGDDEISQLRAENKIIKQQLNELNSLRNDAAEVKFLRSQMEELISLRKKVAEMEVLKGQLGELNALRAKVAKLDSVKAQCAEINNLRNQVSQMNMMKQQLGELDALKAKVVELSGVQSQLGELNRLRAQVGQVEVLKSQLDELTKLKSNAGDLDELRRKIAELENIKSQYELEIKSLREGKSSNEQSKLIHETKLRSTGMESKQLYFEDKPEQICVKGEIIHNTDELELLTRKINKMNQKLTLTLLYKASADSDKASVFHEKCDEAKGSLVLVETDKGKRFGGYTSCSWSGDCIDKKDENAFVFSLDKMEIYDNIPGEDAIGCYPKFGPIFLGCQIRIYDNAFTKGGTTFEKGLNFNTEEKV